MSLARTAVRSVRRRPSQSLLIGVAILAATAFAVASLLLALNARGALIAFGMSTPPSADAVVIPGGDLDPSTVAQIAAEARALPGTTDVVTEYLGDVEVGAGGTSSSWKLTSDPGSGPLSAVPPLVDGLTLSPGEVVLGMATAERTGASVGDLLTIDDRAFTVAAIAPVHEFGRDVALVHVDDAETIDAMTPVQMFLRGDIDLEALEATAPGIVVVSGDERRADEARSVTDTLVGVFGALTVFVGLAVFAAIVIVNSTFRVLLARRAAELALLRCIGATRAQVRRSILLEAACIGLLGGLVGVALGIALAAGLVAAARTAGLLTDPFSSAPLAMAAFVLLSVVSAVVAALPAARAAGRTSPVAALGAARSSEAHPARLGRRLVAASALALSAVATGAGGAAVSRTDQFLGLALAALSGTLVFAMLVVVGPFLIRWCAVAVRPVVASSTAMRLAVSNARRSSRRTAAMTTVLTLGVGMTAALIVGVAGATEDARENVEQNFPAAAIIPLSLVADPDAVRDALSAHAAVDARIDGLDILIDPAPGTSIDAVRSAVLESTPAGTPVYWAADVQAGIEQTILIGQAIGGSMIGITLVVAMIGVMVTLALSVAERRQEIALLRALGVTRAGARRSIAAEAALAAVVGATTGVVFGSGYGVLALHVMGMSAGVAPVGALVALAGGVVVAAIAAAAIPMRTAGRVPPAEGLAAR